MRSLFWVLMRRWRAFRKASPDNSRIICSNHGYGRPSGRPRASNPATYCSSMPRIQAPAVARWHGHLHGLATLTRELSGLAVILGKAIVCFGLKISNQEMRGRPSQPENGCEGLKILTGSRLDYDDLARLEHIRLDTV
jgi:hypothetical protein